MAKIITSLNVYNFHLIITYLNEGVEIYKFPGFINKYHSLKSIYKHKINFESTLNEITTFKHFIVGISDYKIKYFPLEFEGLHPILFTELENKTEALQLSYNHDLNNLLVYRSENIIEEFNTNTNYVVNELKITSIKPNQDVYVSNMIGLKNNIYISFRGFGGCEIIERKEEKIYRSEDAQDIIYLERTNCVAIADGIEGLIIFDKKNLDRVDKHSFSGDIAQELKLYKKNILIKGKQGLYIYNFNTNKVIPIWTGSTGAFTTYYDLIFFAHKNKVHLICSESWRLILSEFLEQNDIVYVPFNLHTS